MSQSVLRLPQVKAKAGLSRSAIYSLEKTGDFPARIPLGARSVGWIESEVQAWIDVRMSARKAAK